MDSFDVAVIGSGPGGYVAAIRAAQAGLKTVCIEKNPTLGGTCLNVGCIPSKALLEATGLYAFMQAQGKQMGIDAGGLKADFDVMMKRKNEVVKSLTLGIKGLFKKNQVQSIFGKGSLVSPHEIQIEGGQRLEAKHIILATGSEPTPLPFLPFDEKRIVSSTGALELAKIPKKLLIVGAGVIGLEIGSIYARLGSSVEFVEMLDYIGGALDPTIEKMLQAALKKQGLNFQLGTSLTNASDSRLEADIVLVAVGRRPFTAGLGLSEAKVAVSPKGFVVVDDSLRTNVPHIYAIGDLIEGPGLAHRASEEGVAVAEIIAGLSPKLDYMQIPGIIYTHPEVASLGFTEPEAKEKGLTVFTGTCPFAANARARCAGDLDGTVKVIGDKLSGKLIGMHIIGSHASELIQEGVIAIKNRMTVEELANTCFGHPTLSECIKEACLVALGRPINI